METGKKRACNLGSLSSGASTVWPRWLPWRQRIQRGLAQASDVGHHNGKSTPVGSRHRPLTCLNSWNVWQCLPPEICRATGKGVERKEEGEVCEEGICVCGGGDCGGAGRKDS